MSTSYRTGAEITRCADCNDVLGTVSSCLFVYGKDGELLCPQCAQLREIAETETAERIRRRRERLATTLRLGSTLACVLVAAAVRTETMTLVAIAIWVVGYMVSEVLSPFAFRSSSSRCTRVFTLALVAMGAQSCRRHPTEQELRERDEKLMMQMLITAAAERDLGAADAGGDDDAGHASSDF